DETRARQRRPHGGPPARPSCVTQGASRERGRNVSGDHHTHVVNNGKRDLTLDELALMQPGMDRLMAEVGPRAHRLYYAANRGNWRLADYFYRSMVKQLRLCATSRPKYDADITAYLEHDCTPVRNAIRDRDAVAFEAA